jgi:MFS family permease
MKSSSPSPTVAPSRKVWTVGTLTYASGGLVILFCWLLAGDFAWAMKERSVVWVVQLLIRKFEASDMMAGLLIGTLPQVLALVLTPIVSYRSDRHRGRWGRRIPFLIIPTPVAALSMVGLAFSPAMGTWLHHALGGSSPGENPSILIVFGLFWAIFEVATIIANSVFFGLINDVVPKEVLGRFYGLFRAIGLIVAMVFNFWIFGKAETHYTAIFIGIGVLYGVGFTTMCFKVKEGSYPPPPPQPDRAGGLVPAVRTYFRECFRIGYYRWIYASISLSWMAIMAINLFNLFFAKSVNMSMDIYGKYLAATFLISFLLSYLLGVLADRFHPLRLSLVTMALFAAVTLAGGIFVTDATSFGVALIAYGVCSGAWQTSAASLALRLFPQARFAQFESARALVSSLGVMLVGPVLGRVLDFTGHNYRLAYIVGGTFALLALLTGLVVHAKFMKLGGPVHYVPPEP